MKIGKIINTVVVLACLSALVYFGVVSRQMHTQYSQIDDEGVIDTAVVIRDFIGAKRKLYYEYVFAVENQRYNGFLEYSPSHGQILIGDSCLVIYLPEDPDEINELVRDEEGYIKKIE